MKCPWCGAAATAGERACSYCGGEIDAGAPAPTTTDEPTFGTLDEPRPSAIAPPPSGAPRLVVPVAIAFAALIAAGLLLKMSSSRDTDDESGEVIDVVLAPGESQLGRLEAGMAVFVTTLEGEAGANVGRAGGESDDAVRTRLSRAMRSVPRHVSHAFPATTEPSVWLVVNRGSGELSAKVVLRRAR